LITLHDVDLAVEEARRAVTKRGVAALSLCPEPINGKRIHDRCFDPLWGEIETLGVALCFHPPARPKQEQVANKLFGHPNANIVALALRNPVELILAVSEFCAGGVLERFPKLRVAFLEGNCAWLPWLLYRLDERAKLHGPLADVPLSKPPSDYFLRQCYISVDPDEHLVSDVVKRIGNDNLLVSTDYPHIDSHFPHALDEFFELEGLGDDSRKKILQVVRDFLTGRFSNAYQRRRTGTAAQVLSLPALFSSGIPAALPEHPSHDARNEGGLPAHHRRVGGLRTAVVQPPLCHQHDG
jgi:predicted TIM-barrel fold metal-dependent hydrolase